MFETWVKGCAETDTNMYCLEGDGDTAVYKLWKTYNDGRYDHIGVITFHVWWRGKRVCVTQSYQEAISQWNNLQARTCEVNKS